MKSNVTIRIENKILDRMNNYISKRIFRSYSQMVEIIIREWLENNNKEEIESSVHHPATLWRRQVVNQK